MTRFIVVGAGLIGSSIAYRLAERGHPVTIVECDYPGAGTSGASFAWTNSNEKTPYSYHLINALGMRAHRELENEFGACPWFHGGGAVEWRADANEAQELAERVQRLTGWNYAAEWIPADRLHRLEPALARGASGDAKIAYFPDEGWVDPGVYIEFFLGKARTLGAELCRETVIGIELRADRVTGVRTASGTTLGADVVVNCTGCWANDLGQDVRLTFPLAPTTGLLVVSAPAAPGIRRVIRTSGVNLRPDGAGRIMLHSEQDEKRFTPDSSREETMPVAAAMVERAARLCPDLAGVRPEAMRLSRRAIPGDGVSAVGPVPGISGYYAAVTHSGATLAPWLGQVVAAELGGSAREPALQDFRPARFF
ncbi:NAD(P)/FAD-dependent oxidoreductase [Mesorhizobium humile]|uniref:FAD-binding oxidoreductase n=1 Tax=Mesorhizobium humile TaxID=3072313 RepID=A0ABU4YLX5_9HYPH|nr:MULTISPECIES: FAD-binding oxidoreductase [unclassified Mesorhizobium]MDX8457896.1 FAD-binding oxidoreductase [Mesorhizobium sp. VK2D]MDX8487976.1 FAD-binding oxidoreductase [Mesorhizobium sp. VK2B]